MPSVGCVLPVWRSLLNERPYAFLRITKPKIVNHHFTGFSETFSQLGCELWSNNAINASKPLFNGGYMGKLGYNY